MLTTIAVFDDIELIDLSHMFSELFNDEFLSHLYQLLLVHSFSFGLVAEFNIYFVLNIYRMILTLLCSMIFAAARVLLTKCLLETMSSIETSLGTWNDSYYHRTMSWRCLTWTVSKQNVRSSCYVTFPRWIMSSIITSMLRIRLIFDL